MAKNNKIIEILEEAIKQDNGSTFSPTLFPALFKVDDDALEDFLNKYCLRNGLLQDIIDFFADDCIEEFERRMNFVECINADAYNFVAGEIISYLCNGATLYKSESFYSSYVDLVCCDMEENSKYILIKADKNNYYLFDFSECCFDWRTVIDNEYICNPFEVSKRIDDIRKKVQEHADDMALKLSK